MVGILKSNLKFIQEQMNQCQKPGIEPLLVAVSKKQPIEKIEILYNEGVKDFGENYLQEALVKQDQLKHLNIRWHYIGQLQTKKIKDIVGNFDLIQTVCREEEIIKISNIARKKEITQKILIQINLAREETKQGVSIEELDPLVQLAQASSNIELCGFMVFPPLENRKEDSMKWFSRATSLFASYKKRLSGDFRILSMGTSGDYTLALDSGSNLIRLGEVLMGPR